MRRTTSAGRGLIAALRRALVRSWLLLSMLTSIGVVLTVAVWSAARERADSLADFSGRQALLATAVGADFQQRLSASTTPADGGSAQIGDDLVLELLVGARKLENPHDLIVLVARPDAPGFLTTDKRIIPSTRLRNAVDSGVEAVIVPRDEAAAFGLPRRTAIAGLARVPIPQRGTWSVVVLASAQRMRDRQILEERRLAVTVIVVTIVVTAFGAVARRRQRRELELERQIAISTLEREREAALARAGKMAALAALSTGIAHEVGTPLGVIVGRVEQVVPRIDDERGKLALGVVLEQVERIHRIVRGCLALARGDAPQLVRTAPESLASRAIDLVRHRFGNAGIELQCHNDPNLPSVACEPSLFEQALVNVLLNACEASPRGGTVRLTVHATERGVSFVIDDDGIGIPDDVARRATEPFFSTRLKEGGSGLGLTIANEIVSHHAGTLTIERRSGGLGTRATISISR
jgi:two-component system, NtrC family, sensor kinase